MPFLDLFGLLFDNCRWLLDIFGLFLDMFGISFADFGQFVDGLWKMLTIFYRFYQ